MSNQRKYNEAKIKAKRVIRSCENYAQIQTAQKYVQNFVGQFFETNLSSIFKDSAELNWRISDQIAHIKKAQAS